MNTPATDTTLSLEEIEARIEKLNSSQLEALIDLLQAKGF